MSVKIQIVLFFLLANIFQTVSQNNSTSKFVEEADSLYRLTTGTIRIVELKEFHKNKLVDNKQKEKLLKTVSLYKLALKNDYLNPAQKFMIKNKISLIYYQLQQPEKSIKILEKILSDKSIEGFGLAKLFGQNLLEFYKEKSDYKKIINLYKRINFFRQQTSCHRQKDYERLYFTHVLAETYFETGEYEKSLKYSLPVIFLAEIYKEQNLLKIIRQSLKTIYPEDELQNKLNYSIKHPYQTGKKLNTRYFINFLGYPVEIPYYYVERKNNQLNIKQEKIKKSRLYQIIFRD